MPEEFAAASAPHIYPKRHKQVRETIEIMQGIWPLFTDVPVSKTLDGIKRLKPEIMPKVGAT